jgi:hypothetical protein
MGAKKSLTILSEEHLKGRNTKNLLYILKKARAEAERCRRNLFFCECCNEYHDAKNLEPWGNEEAINEAKKMEEDLVKPYDDYVTLLKIILSTREHVA